MKQKLTSFLTLALLASASSAWADGDQTGSSAIENGTYYLYDKEAGVFLSRGCAWGTEASADKYGIPLNITLTDGAYTFQPYDDTEKYIGKVDAGVYTDIKDASNWTLTADNGGYLISTTASKYMTHASGTLGEYITLTDTKENATNWQVMTKADRDAIVNAYPAANTAAVAKSANLTTDNLETTLAGYISSVVKTIAPTDYAWKKVGSWGNANTTNPREAFCCTGNFTYSITGLTEGIYKVSINAFERDGSNGNNVAYANSGYYITTSYLQANDQQVRVKGWAEDRTNDSYPNSVNDAKTLFDEGKYRSDVYVYVGSDGKLDLTAAVPSTLGDHWFIMGNTVITYYTNNVSAELSEALITTAKSLSSEKMESSVKTALDNAVTALGANKTSKDLYQKLSDAVTAAQASVDAYAAAKAELDKRADMIESLNTNLYTAEAYATYYTTPWAKYENLTLTTEEAKALPENNGWHEAAQFNLFLGSAFGVNSYNDIPYINTWSNEGAEDGSNFITPFYEYWNWNTLGDKTLTATVNGLEPGNYAVSAWVRVQVPTSDSKPAPTGITFKANDGEAATITGTLYPTKGDFYLDEYTVYGTVGSDGILKITFNVAKTNASWLSFKNVNYVKVESATLTEATGVAPLTAFAGKPVDVSFTREFTGGVSSTVCLPFEATPDESAGKFYAFAGVTEKEGVYTVNMTQTAATLAANTPYLFAPATTGKVTFTGTVAEAATTYTPTDVTKDEWTFAGTYSQVTYDEDSKWGDYAAIYGYVAKDLGDSGLKPGEFVKMKKPGKSYTPAFRAVMKYKAASDGSSSPANVRGSIALPSSLQVVLVDADGTITEIGAVDVDTDTSDCSWYTIDGRKLQGKPSVKGIYINSGKKVLIK